MALALLARRWGQDPNALRYSLTEDQFRAYLEIEREAQVEDRWISAVAVLAAIGAAFGKKGSQALPRFEKLLQGERAMPETERGLRDRVTDALRSTQKE